MKTRVREFHRILTDTFGRIRATSLAVTVAVAAELATGLTACLVAWGRLSGHLVGLVDLDELPPWHALLTFPAIGAAAAVLRARRPDQALRRWHGVALRRIDERFG